MSGFVPITFNLPSGSDVAETLGERGVLTPCGPFQGAEPAPESTRKPERVWIACSID